MTITSVNTGNLARKVEGVKDVENNITVTSGPTAIAYSYNRPIFQVLASIPAGGQVEYWMKPFIRKASVRFDREYNFEKPMGKCR